MSKVLFVLNDPPYGTERTYNALRLASALAQRNDEEVRVFLMGDAAPTAKSGQTLPNGFYHLGRMLTVLAQRQVPLGVCGSCMDARGLTPTELLEGAHKSSLEELTDWTEWADKVLVF